MSQEWEDLVAESVKGVAVREKKKMIMLAKIMKYVGSFQNCHSTRVR